MYPEILKSCMKALCREYYRDELFDYLKYIRVDSVVGMNDVLEKTINNIYVYYLGEDMRKYVMIKIR